MCTLTWHRDQGRGLEVFFNRDEKKSRPIAAVPAEFREHGINFLSPRDPAGGGTWMLVNERGWVVCLLNKWELEGRLEGKTKQSRGRLVWSLGGVGSFAEIEAALAELENYPAFRLVVFSPESEQCWDWDGRELVRDVPTMPMTSSSYRFEEVRAHREGMFGKGVRGEEYHASPGSEPCAYTVRMCRGDAQTWSRSHVVVGQRITWDYLAEQPDLVGPPKKTRIELYRR